jgi:chaperonin GroEL (HSP60 family)
MTGTVGRTRVQSDILEWGFKEQHFGFNAESAEFADLIKIGVIDPAKVTRLALQNTASIASTMLTTDGLIAEIKEQQAQPQEARLNC